MDRLFLLCKVDVLLPDIGDIPSHVETYHYVVVPSFFDRFVSYFNRKYDFCGIRKLGNLVSSDPNFVHCRFKLL